MYTYRYSTTRLPACLLLDVCDPVVGLETQGFNVMDKVCDLVRVNSDVKRLIEISRGLPDIQL